MEAAFVRETDLFRKQRLKVIIPLLIFLILVASLLIFTGLGKQLNLGEVLSLPAPGEFKPTALDLLVLGFVGALFFIPMPQEAFYGFAVSNGGAWLPLLLAIMAGMIAANVVNYFVGWKLNTYAVHLVSAKKLYPARRWVNRYGGLAVFVFNVLPLPSPVLTFALGIVRYNATRLFFWLTLGTIVKFTVITVMLTKPF